MLLGLVLSISIIVLPNNISAVIRALNTDEDNRTGQDVPHFQVGENPYKIAIDTSDDIVYVANKLSDTVSVIDTNTMEVSNFTVRMSYLNWI
jgi:DNA-binding beta-propeller fold protein YncE